MRQKKKNKLFSVLLLAFVLVFTAAAPAFALESAPAQSVMLNGKLLHFQVAPAIVDGRMMVSVDEFNSQIAEPIGEAVSASDFTTTTINGTLMAPLRSLCDELGLSLSWDAPAKTAVIIDFDTLLGDMDETYSILNRLMQLSYEPDKTYQTTSNSTGVVNVDAGESFGKVKADVKSTVDMLNQNTNMSGVFHMSFNYDLSNLTQQISEDELATMEQMLAPLKSVDIQMIFNADEEVFYIQLGALGDLLATVMGMSDIDKDTWIKADLSSLIDASGYDEFIRALLAGDTSVMSMESLMSLILDRSNAYGVDDYEGFCVAFDLMEELFSDKAFVVTGSSTLPTYELTLNAQKLQSAMLAVTVKHPSLLTGGLGDMSSADLEKLFNYNMKMKFTVKGPHEYTASLSYQYDIDMAELLNELTSDSSADADMEMKMNVESEFPGKTVTDLSYLYSVQFGTFSISMDMSLKDTTTVSTTNRTVLKAPPAGAKIYDLTPMISSLL